MGNCVAFTGRKIYAAMKSGEEKESEKLNKNQTIATKKEEDREKDKKAVNYNMVFEEIMDVKDLQIKGAMLLSETEGKPKETYTTIVNIAPGKIKFILKK
jgi:hypothetical protein